VCSAPINGPSESCPACGYIYPEELAAELKSFFLLSDEASFLVTMAGQITARRKTVASRVQQAEKKLAAMIISLGKKAKAPMPQKKPPVSVQLKPEPAAAARSVEQNRIPREKKRHLTEENLGQKWLLIAGIVILLFGVGYFLKYSFEQGWIGPVARILMAYTLGVILLAGGNRFRSRGLDTFGLSIMGGGLAVFYFSTFAAFQIYDLFGQVYAFAFMILVTILAASLSLIHDSKWLAVLALVGGFLTPAFLGTGENNQLTLMTYMVLLNGGILVIAFFRKWSILNLLGFFFTWALYSGWHGAWYSDEAFWVTIFYITVFFLIYSIVPFAYYLVRLTKDEELRGFYIVVPGSFIAFAYSFAVISEHFSQEAVSFIAFLYGFIFLLMAGWLYREGRTHLQAFVVLLAKSAFFVAVGIPLLFKGPWITIFWAALAPLLLFLGISLKRKPLFIQAYLVLAAALVKYLFYDFSEIFHLTSGFFFRDGYSDQIMSRYVLEIFIFTVLFFFMRLVKKEKIYILNSNGDGSLFSALTGSLLFVTLQFEVLAFFHHYLPEGSYAALSVYWALYSIGVMAVGFRYNSSSIRRTAMALFGVTVLKVFLFDTAKFSTPYRILSFFLVGLLLVGASYLYYRFKDTIIEAVADREEE